MRAAIYTRISDDRAGTGLGVTRQERACRELAESRGWTIVAVACDNDASAYSGKRRPEYHRLLDSIEAGQVDVLIAWASDRITRSPLELEGLIDVLDRNKVSVATVTSGTYDLESPEGRASARIHGVMSRQESERKSIRSEAKHEELARAGRVSGGGTRPFGFEEDRITHREAEAKMIREAADRVLGGEPIRSVLRDWQRRDVKTVTGARWRTTSLKRILTAGRTAGLRYYRGERVGPAVWDGILTEEEHERLRALLLDPSRLKGTGPRRYPLRGLLVCGNCGALMVARPRADGRRAYVCASGESSPDFDGCGKRASLAEPLEAEVLDRVVSVLAGDGLAHALEAGQRKDDDHKAARELAEARKRRDDLAGMFAAGDLSRSEWLTARERVQARVDALEARLQHTDRVGVLAGLEATEEALRAAWADRDVEWQGAFLSAVIERVELGEAVRGRNFFDPDRVTVVWRF